MPLVDVKKVGDKFRLVEKGSRRIARMHASGKARDGGGHTRRKTAYSQMEHVNAAIRKMGYS